VTTNSLKIESEVYFVYLFCLTNKTDEYAVAHCAFYVHFRCKSALSVQLCEDTINSESFIAYSK